MAWPKNLNEVQCVGFDRYALSALARAIDDKRVKWGASDGFAGLTTAEFDYLGFRYRLTELIEVVVKIEKIAKLDEDDEGNELVEDLVKAQRQAEYADWGGF